MFSIHKQSMWVRMLKTLNLSSVGNTTLLVSETDQLTSGN